MLDKLTQISGFVNYRKNKPERMCELHSAPGVGEAPQQLFRS